MRALSLYSGAGGFDIGIQRAGFEVVWANDYDKNACASYAHNIGDHIRCGDILDFLPDFDNLSDIDLVVGGPPCQGFSVAGKMDPNDPRSRHVWNFVDVVKKLSPSIFLMENVKALGKLSKWEPLREKLLERFRSLGYATNFVVLNASDFDVPQARERVFFVGFKMNSIIVPDLSKMLEPYRKTGPTVRKAIGHLDIAGTGNNQQLSKAKITLTANPILRKSPFAGMMFNGLGRPIRLDGFSATLPASMGGNKTPIIDNEELYNGEPNWVVEYHNTLIKGGKPMEYQVAPDRLRRLTVQEASAIQTFPHDYVFQGSQSSCFRQIGNAVPPNLGERIGRMLMDYLINDVIIDLPYQLQIAELDA